MVEYSIVITETAEKDLNAIIDYIGVDRKEPNSAISIYTKIKEKILTLSELPTRTKLVGDVYLADKGYRMLLVEKYIVFYRVDEESTAVEIVRILYSKRNWIDII